MSARTRPLLALAATAFLTLATASAVSAHGDEAPVPLPSCGPAASSAPAASPGMMSDGMTSGGMASPAPASMAPMGPMASAAPAPAIDPCAGALRIEVTLLDTMRMDPAELSVPAGVPITFVVTNAGAIAHEFTLGDAADQVAHDAEMLKMGGQMMADEPDAMGVAAGETKELTWVFAEPGEMEAGCHVPGHYPAGMKLLIHVTD